MFNSQLAESCLEPAAQSGHQLLLVPAVAGFGLIVAHSLYTRGWRDTLWLLLPILFFGYLRESPGGQDSEYLFSGNLGPKLGYVPLIIPIGWAFACYIGLCVAERVVAASERFRGNLFAVTAALMWTVLFISMCVEVTGARAGWWFWQYSVIHDDLWIYCTPKFVMMNWAFTSLCYCLPFLLMRIPRFQGSPTRYLFLLIYLYPFLGRPLLGPIFNVIVLITLILFMCVLPFKARLDMEPANDEPADPLV